MMASACDVAAALRVRHSGDLFATEVLCGSSGAPRLDAWAMPRSWANWTTHGFEIKVSRSDFTGDAKLDGYSAFVHQFWLACPWGLIAPEEVAPGVGLLWLTKTGGRLITKRKAVRGSPEKWTKPLLSLAINRARIGRASEVPPLDDDERRRAIRQWLDGKAQDFELGRAVGHEVRQRLLGRLDASRTAEGDRLRRFDEAKREQGVAWIDDVELVRRATSPGLTCARELQRDMVREIERTRASLARMEEALQAAVAQTAKEGA